MTRPFSRRSWLGAAGAAGVAAALPRAAQAAAPDQAQIAITFDLEMSRHYPVRGMTHWDYEKGNLNAQTKQYSVEAGKRVKDAGGVIHYFAVGRVLEQENIDWLKGIVEAGHPVGNHTYDHVNVRATTLESVQFRFQRSPWLVRGRTPSAVIRENIRLCELALAGRLGKKPDGFRTPGGFNDGLRNHPAVRAMLKELGYDWVSSLYPPHPNTKPMEQPSAAVIEGIVAAQAQAQPFVYDDGMVEIPMSPVSDVNAFRSSRWKLDWFLKTIGACVQWAIDNRAVFDFLCHPSCMYVVDPEFKTVDMICEMVADAGDRAAIVDLGTIAKRARRPSETDKQPSDR